MGWLRWSPQEVKLNVYVPRKNQSCLKTCMDLAKTLQRPCTFARKMVLLADLERLQFGGHFI